MEVRLLPPEPEALTIDPGASPSPPWGFCGASVAVDVEASHLCFGSNMTEEVFGVMCLLSLLTVGPLLIWLGARAAGLGVLASVVGAFVGALTTRTMDDLTSYVPIGTSVALFVGGFAGLFWRSWARRSTLLMIGMVVAALGIAVTLVVEGSIIARGRTLISDIGDPTMRVLFPLDAVFVVLLCLVQPVHAATPSEPPLRTHGS
jgi:peptidoglycan/LPS O-acetylase OafA/YrhL